MWALGADGRLGIRDGVNTLQWRCASPDAPGRRAEGRGSHVYSFGKPVYLGRRGLGGATRIHIENLTSWSSEEPPKKTCVKIENCPSSRERDVSLMCSSPPEMDRG